MDSEILWAYHREQADEAAGRRITDEEAARISKAIGYSTAPDAAGEVVFQVCSAEEPEYTPDFEVDS